MGKITVYENTLFPFIDIGLLSFHEITKTN